MKKYIFSPVKILSVKIQQCRNGLLPFHFVDNLQPELPGPMDRLGAGLPLLRAIHGETDQNLLSGSDQEIFFFSLVCLFMRFCEFSELDK